MGRSHFAQVAFRLSYDAVVQQVGSTRLAVVPRSGDNAAAMRCNALDVLAAMAALFLETRSALMVAARVLTSLA